MKHCEECRIHINTNNNVCPLCYEELEKSTNSSPNKTKKVFEERQENKKVEKNGNLLQKIFLFISIVAVTICAFINISTADETLWALCVFLCIVYIWILITHTILSSRSLLEKVFLQIGFIIAILAYFQWISGGEWLANIAVPCVGLLAIFVLNIISISGMKKYKFILSCLTMYCIFFILCGILALLAVTTFKLLNIIVVLYALLSFLGTVMFAGNILKSEWKKKMHI